ncbi:hypothetical protein ALC60_04616, partial [Trachymyrmex zeteki]
AGYAISTVLRSFESAPGVGVRFYPVGRLSRAQLRSFDRRSDERSGREKEKEEKKREKRKARGENFDTAKSTASDRLYSASSKAPLGTRFALTFGDSGRPVAGTHSLAWSSSRSLAGVRCTAQSVLYIREVLRSRALS